MSVLFSSLPSMITPHSKLVNNKSAAPAPVVKIDQFSLTYLQTLAKWNDAIKLEVDRQQQQKSLALAKETSLPAKSSLRLAPAKTKSSQKKKSASSDQHQSSSGSALINETTTTTITTSQEFLKSLLASPVSPFHELHSPLLEVSMRQFSSESGRNLSTSSIKTLIQQCRCAWSLDDVCRRNVWQESSPVALREDRTPFREGTSPRMNENSLLSGLTNGDSMTATSASKTTSPVLLDDEPCGFLEPPGHTSPHALSNWNRSLLLDEEEVLNCDSGIVTAAAEPIVEEKQQHEKMEDSECTANRQSSALVLERFLKKMLVDLWDADHPSPDFDTEATKAKRIPVLINDALKYLDVISNMKKQQHSASPPAATSSTTIISGGGASSTTFLPLPQKYPPPRFVESPFASEANRLLKWLNTWRGGAENDDDDDTDDEDSTSSGKIEKRKDTSSPPSLTPVADVGTFFYDDRGRRYSARIARIEEKQRLAEEEEERQRQKQRGYFSNDTTHFGNVSAHGGAGALTNIAVITGPCGIGKTAAACIAAHEMGYRVVEINTSMKRTPKLIEKTIAEATQSKQIKLQCGTAEAGRQELEKIKIAAEQAKRAAQEALQRERLAAEKSAAEIKEKERLRVAEELAKQKSLAKRAAGIKKENGISKEAIANFFQKKPKAPPPPENAVIVDVDNPSCPVSSAPVVHQIDMDSDNGSHVPKYALDLNHAFDDVETEKRAIHGSTAGGVDGTASTTTRKRPREDVSGPNNKSVVVDEKDAGVSSTKVSGIDAAVSRELLPLILIESGDIVCDDETPRAFYNTIRDMASESKFPIIVTANKLTPSQITAFFGHGTPHTEMKPPSRMYVILQIFLVMLVEKGCVTVLSSTSRLVDCDWHRMSALLKLSHRVVDEADCPGDIRRCLYQLQLQLRDDEEAPRVEGGGGVNLQEGGAPPSSLGISQSCVANNVDTVCGCDAIVSQSYLAQEIVAFQRFYEDEDSSSGDDQERDGGEFSRRSAAVQQQQQDGRYAGYWIQEQLMQRQQQRMRLRDRVVGLSHRTRGIAARLHSMKSPCGLVDVAAFLPKCTAANGKK